MRLSIAAALLALLLPVLHSRSDARTWHVRPDGLGDAPTIQAGIDSAATGDTVLVAPGEYEASLVMKNGVSLVSEAGPYHTRLQPAPPQREYIIWGSNLGQHWTEITGFWFEGCVWNELGAIYLTTCKRVDVMNNIFTGNNVGVYVTNGSAYLFNNTFFGNFHYGFDASAVGSGLMVNNIMWSRAVGFDRVWALFNDFLVLTDAGPLNTENFSLNPQFCGAGAGNFYLQSDSPCAPGNAPYEAEGLIGALPVSCGSVDAKNRTWGGIKALYLD
jgi:parallel beta-helix repeat protein